MRRLPRWLWPLAAVSLFGTGRIVVPVESSNAHRMMQPSSHASDSLAPLPIELCGAGVFRMSLGGKSAGEERFQVDCRSDGSITARGRTQLTLPVGASDVETEIEFGASLVPTRITARGQVMSARVDQEVQIAGGVATIASEGTTRQIPAPSDASYLGSNVYYVLPFIIARYDRTRGGEQQIPVWPGGSVAVTYVGADHVPSMQGARFDRYTLVVHLQRVVLWFDARGRIAVISVPAQRFTAVREGAEGAAASLDRLLSDGSTSVGAAGEDYSAPADAAYVAEEVAIPVGRYVLAGTLLVPRQGHPPFAAAVMITGSGQQNRDEVLPIAGLEHFRPFRQIAEALASAGVAVLRVDDRGVGGSTGAETLPLATTSSFAGDTRAEVAYLRTRAEIDPDRIALIGHSEGATIATMVAAEDARVAAIVLMAGTAKTGAEVSVEQLESMLASDTTRSAAEQEALVARQREVAKKIVAGEEVPGLQHLAWTREYFAYDPLPAIRRTRQPILILQGGRDQQVAPEHADLLARAARDGGNRDVTERVFPTLNHLFLPAATGAVTEYPKLEVTALGGEVLGTIRDWLVARLRVDK
jgi:pimeloyl-ACP methyl ester carboxylesterase